MKTHRAGAFTLVEILVSTALVVVIMGLLVTVMDQTGKVWERTRGRTDQFRDARAAFDSMTQRLSQATLNTYWDYDKPSFPTRYQRRSELRFTSGQAETLLPKFETRERLTTCVFFHAPAGFSATEGRPVGAAADRAAQGYRGLENMVNAWGYYLEFGDDIPFRPAFVSEQIMPKRFRFRLMEFMLPSEKLVTYNLTSGSTSTTVSGVRVFDKPFSNTYNKTGWFLDPLNAAMGKKDDSAATIHVLAENIVALAIIPRLPKREEQELQPAGGDNSPLAPNYEYDSSPKGVGDSRYTKGELNPTNQVPPVLQVTMVAIDERSAVRAGLTEASANVFHVRSRFKETSKFTEDLRIDSTKAEDADQSLERELIRQRVQYRIFTSNVPIRTAKWSRDQTE
jgi:uncharacterized protein (TIGR02599 family)